MSSAMADQQPAEWLSPQQVAGRYPVSIWTVYRDLDDGHLQHVGGGRKGVRIWVRSDWAEHWWMTRSDRSLF